MTSFGTTPERLSLARENHYKSHSFPSQRGIRLHSMRNIQFLYNSTRFRMRKAALSLLELVRNHPSKLAAPEHHAKNDSAPDVCQKPKRSTILQCTRVQVLYMIK
jgi:hypothetical protein